MEGHKSKGGIGLLQLALGKMYHNPLVIFREYIQNACDGLEDAVRSHVIENDEKNILITINRSRHQIVFEDKGVGVSSSKIGETLVDIGNSQKTDEQIGQYGIGRLIAAKYCDRIVFETSYQGEPSMSILTWETKKAFDLIDSKGENDFTKIIDKVTNFKSVKEESGQHYFRVTLDNVNDYDLLEESKVYDYIAQTAPVDFSFEYKDELMKPALDGLPEYKQLMSDERSYRITLNDRDVRKLYESEVNNVKLTPPQFFSISDVNYGLMAWGWYSLPLNITEMNDSPFRGIRLRKYNMAIGLESILTEYFPKPVDAFHFTGEIYIVHKGIEPSGSRDGIGFSQVANVFKNELKEKCQHLHDLYAKVYRFGNDYLKKLSDGVIELQKDEVKLKQETNKEERKKIRNSIKQRKEEIGVKVQEMNSKKNDLKAIEGSEELIKYITDYNDRVQKDKVEKYNSVKGRDKKSQVKTVKIEQISENFKDDQELIDEDAERKKEIDPLNGLSEQTRRIIIAVKKVIDSETTLTDQIRERLMKNILRKVQNK